MKDYQTNGEIKPMKKYFYSSKNEIDCVQYSLCYRETNKNE